jgi:hypothetical protein
MRSTTTSARRHPIRTAALAATIALLSAAAASCGGDSSDDTDGAAAVTDAPASGGSDSGSDTTSSSSGGEASDKGRICELVGSVDLSAAFGGAIQFGEPSGSVGRDVCTVPVVGAEGEGLIVQITIAENYEAKALYEDQGLPFERLDGLGQEAFIVNDADLNVLLNDTESLSVGLSAIYVGETAPPAADVVKAGLIDITTSLVEGL